MVTVLVVDDDEAIRTMVHSALEDAGYRVREARQGDEALTLLHESTTPMVVLVDLLMPVVSGFELLQRVAEDWDLARRNAYVVVTASEDSLPVVQALRSATVVEGLAKPFDIDTLIAAVEHASAVLPQKDSGTSAHQHNIS
jgi:CheY-like chemotaxis protein